MTQTEKQVVKVLVLDDDAKMADTLVVEGLLALNSGEAYLPENVPCPDGVLFEPRAYGDLSKLSEALRGTPDWDVFVIDRMFGGAQGEDLAASILRSLNDLHVTGLRIVWTAYPNDENRRDCFRLGVWDYIDKTTPKHGNAFTDVLVSIVEGLEEKNRQVRRGEIAQKAHQYIVDHYGAIYAEHKGEFAAFQEAPGAAGVWHVIGSSESLYQLYDSLERNNEIDINEVHIALIQA